MIVIPAIDLRGGKVVRLTQGEYDRDWPHCLCNSLLRMPDCGAPVSRVRRRASPPRRRDQCHHRHGLDQDVKRRPASPRGARPKRRERATSEGCIGRPRSPDTQSPPGVGCVPRR